MPCATRQQPPRQPNALPSDALLYVAYWKVDNSHGQHGQSGRSWQQLTRLLLRRLLRVVILLIGRVLRASTRSLQTSCGARKQSFKYNDGPAVRWSLIRRVTNTC